MITVHYKGVSLRPNQPWAPSVHGVIPNSEGRILLHKREDSSLWALPGGKMELGESVVSCLQRELLEETGFQVSPEKLLGIFSSPEYLLSVQDKVVQPFLIVFLCDVQDEKPTINDESVEFQWVDEQAMKSMETFPLVKEIAHWAWNQTSRAFFDSSGLEAKLKPAAKRRLDRFQKDVAEGKNLSPSFDTAEDAIRYLRS